MTSWITSWFWTEESAPQKVVTVQPQPLMGSSNVLAAFANEEMLADLKAKLRPTQTRVAPEKYPSRIPHIAEMAEVHKAYRRQQKQLREFVPAPICKHPPTPPPLPGSLDALPSWATPYHMLLDRPHSLQKRHRRITRRSKSVSRLYRVKEE